MNDVDEQAVQGPDARATLSLLALSLKNIGPFDSAEVEFLAPDELASAVPVTIITGESGSGKSIVIDAIRGMFGDQFAEKKAEWQASYEARRAANPKARPESKQYAHQQIVGTLEAMSHKKCFYCEGDETRRSGSTASTVILSSAIAGGC
jgi:DNA repair ATPase RecN